MMKRRNKILLGTITVVGVGIAGFMLKSKYLPKVPLKEFKEFCLEFAVLDDEICRNELEGNTIDGTEIVFDEKGETLQYRYELFREMYKSYSREMLEQERTRLYHRLAESKKYACAPKQELEVDFLED